MKGKTNKKCKENKLLKMWMKRMVNDTVSALPPIFSSCFPANHSCSWVERGLVNIKCLSQEHNTLQLGHDLNPGSSIPGQHTGPLLILSIEIDTWKIRTLISIYLPGPTPRTVLEPGAICVLPASLIRHVSRPKDLPCRVSSTL